MTTSATAPFPLVIVGHVDHGKSTLIGRLLHDTGSLPEERVKALREMSRRRGVTMEWSFLLDAFQAERDQGITIDTTQIFFRTRTRRYVIIDAPGHKEFLKNMITGAASAQAALLVIDAAEGVREQSRRHAHMLSLLGVSQVAVVVNKVDLIDCDAKRFKVIETEIREYLNNLGVTPMAVVPASARHGHGVATRPEELSWHTGPTVVEILDQFTTPKPPHDQPLRFPVQDVLKLDHRRLVVGRVESGTIRVGDRLHFCPDGKIARVTSLETWRAPAKDTALAGESIALTLDEDLFVERGHVATSPDAAPTATHEIAARLFWLGREPLRNGARFKMRLGMATHDVTVREIRSILDVESLRHGQAEEVPRNAVAEVVLHSRRLIVADIHGGSGGSSALGKGVLIQDGQIQGGFVIFAKGAARRAQAGGGNLHQHQTLVSTAERALANGHRGGVLWLTGLSGSGKSTLATRLERALFTQGWQAFVLDGDAVRQRLSSDLDFSPEGRRENIRRVAEMSRFFAEAGFIVITSLISPYRRERDMARSIALAFFHEVYVAADVATCESRDPKGLYAKARRGEITNFTGVSAPYEPPLNPELTVDTGALDVEKSVKKALDYANVAFSITHNDAATKTAARETPPL